MCPGCHSFMLRSRHLCRQCEKGVKRREKKVSKVRQEKGKGVAEVPQGQPEEMVELEATLPPMEEICVTNVHMVKHIPSRLRKR